MDKKVTIPKLVAEELSRKLERYGKEGTAYMMLEMCDSSNDAT
ncbi:hypothetical protein [Bacillus cereus]|nr:hypothetical protein [Bacillus cereus]